MDTAEKMAADIALTMNGGEWKDGKWYSKGHREAWIKAVQPYADEIERLRWENANMEKLWGKSEGTWMEIRDKQDAEIERLRDSLERIACFCQEECKMNCAGRIASSALKEKE